MHQEANYNESSVVSKWYVILSGKETVCVADNSFAKCAILFSILFECMIFFPVKNFKKQGMIYDHLRWGVNPIKLWTCQFLALGIALRAFPGETGFWNSELFKEDLYSPNSSPKQVTRQKMSKV